MNYKSFILDREENLKMKILTKSVISAVLIIIAMNYYLLV